MKKYSLKRSNTLSLEYHQRIHIVGREKKLVNYIDQMRAYCVPKTATIRWFIIFILFSIGTTEAFTLSGYKFSKKLSKNISYVKQSIGYCQLSSKKLLAQEAFDIRDDEESITGSSTSVNFAIHPESEEAFTITSHLGIDESQHSQLAKLAKLVVEMNSRLNLISRKDCTLEVVFGRHIIPSIAIVGIPDTTLNRNQNNEVDESTKKMVIDVGTGGGFPGLPLAIINPHVDFLLVDSVGKKLKAVQEMADELGLQNIQTHHGRAEEILDDSTLRSKYKQAFDICVGRSVTSLPRFCFWIKDFLKQKQEQGKLIYIIGGDIEENLLQLVQNDIPIDDLLNRDGASDKRTLVIKAEEVNRIAKESGEKRQKRGTKSKNNTQNQKKRDAPKGSWTKKDNSVKKSRGYENFKRYG